MRRDNINMKKIFFLSFILVVFLMQVLFVFAEEVAEPERIVAIVTEEENPIEEGLPEVELYEAEEDGLNEVDTVFLEGTEINQTVEDETEAEESMVDKILSNPVYMILAIIVAIIVLSILWNLAKLAFKIGLFIAIVLFVIWILRQFIF